MSSWLDWNAWWDWLGSAASVGGVFFIGLLVVVGSVTSWAMNIFSLPGNWGVLAIAALAAAFAPSSFDASHDGTMLIDWPTVAVLFVLAVAGEGFETVASAAGAAKRGASRRGMALALIGAMAGSIAGATVGVPVPVIGPLIGAVVGGALGAFGGAYAGEAWKGTAHGDRVAIGNAAFSGKIAGMAAKVLIGAVMCAAVTASMFI